MAVKKPAVSKAKAPAKPKPVKIESEAAQFDVATRGEVEVLLNHPDGYPVTMTLHPRKADVMPLRAIASMRKMESAENAGEQLSALVEILESVLVKEELDMLLDNAVMSDVETLLPVLFGSSPL